MTEHLPECADKSVMPHSLDCFCDVIRACEKRVIAAAIAVSEKGKRDTIAAAVHRVETHLIMLDDNGWRATLNGEGYSDLAGFGPGVIAAIKGDQE
jgi:hypothetical protein